MVLTKMYYTSISMKMKKTALLAICITAAITLTGCAVTKNSNNVADQAIEQMLPDGEIVQTEKPYSIFDMNTDIPDECSLNVTEMKEAIENYADTMNQELSNGLVSVVFAPETNEEFGREVDCAVELMVKAEDEDGDTIFVKFNSAKDCFGYLYNRRQVDIHGNVTEFAHGNSRTQGK